MDNKRKEQPPQSPRKSEEQKAQDMATVLAKLATLHSPSSSSSSSSSSLSSAHPMPAIAAMDIERAVNDARDTALKSDQDTSSLPVPGGGKLSPGETEGDEPHPQAALPGAGGRALIPLQDELAVTIIEAARTSGDARLHRVVSDPNVMKVLLEAIRDHEGGGPDALMAMLAHNVSKTYTLFRDFDGGEKIKMSLMRHAGTSSLSRYTKACEREGMPGEENLWWKAGVLTSEIDTITGEEVRRLASKVASDTMTKWMEVTKEIPASNPAYAHEHSQRRGFGAQVLGAGNNQQKSDKGLSSMWLIPKLTYLRDALVYQASLPANHPDRMTELQLKANLNNITNAITKLSLADKDKMFGNAKCAGFVKIAKGAGKKGEKGPYGSSTSVGQLFFHSLVKPALAGRGESEDGETFWVFLEEEGGKKGTTRWNATKATWTLITYQDWINLGGRDLEVLLPEDKGEGEKNDLPPRLPTDTDVVTWDDFERLNYPKQETVLTLALTKPTDKTVDKLKEKLAKKR